MAEEMAQLVKCLSHKQKDLNVFPSTHIRSWGGTMGLEFQSWGGRDIVVLGTHLLACLLCSPIKRPCLKDKRQLAKE